MSSRPEVHRSALRWLLLVGAAGVAAVGAGLASFGAMGGEAVAWLAEKLPAALDVPTVALARRFVAVGVAWCVAGGGVVLVLWRVSSATVALRRDVARQLAREWRRLRRSFRQERRIWLAIGVGTGVHALYAGAGLSQPVRLDEAGTYLNFVSRPVLAIVVDYSSTNNHILHSLLARASILVFGDTTWALRLPAFVAGVLLVPSTYWALRRHFGGSVALASAMWMSLSPHAVDASTNARGYTLLTLAFLVLLATIPDLRPTRRGGGWVTWVVVMAIGFWIVPVMVYAVAIVLTWQLLALWPLRPGAGRWILRTWLPAGAASLLLVLALYSPVFLGTGLEATVEHPTVQNNVAPTTEALGARFVALLADVSEDWTLGGPPALGVTLAILAGIGALVRRTGGVPQRLVVATILGPTLVILTTRIVPPSWIFVFAHPVAFAAVVSAAWSAVRRIGRPLVGARALAWRVALVLLPLSYPGVFPSAGSLPPWYQGYPDAAEAAAVIARRARPDDGVEAGAFARIPMRYSLVRRGEPEPDWGQGTTGVIWLVDWDPRRRKPGYVPFADEVIEPLRAAGWRETEVIALSRSRILRWERPEEASDGTR